MDILLQILMALAPAVVIALVMVNKDPKPEPKKWLWAAVGLGVLICPVIFLLALTGYPIYETDSLTDAILAAFVSAAIPEELLKFLCLYIIASRCKHFDEMFDGIVYAVCIGMGFAGLENILYLFGAEDEWISVGISRALMSVPMHYFFAIIMGAFFSLGWFDKKNQKVYMSAALVLPIIVHGAYDTLCFSMGLDENFSFYILIAFLLGFKYIRRYVKSLTNSMPRLDGIES